MSLTFETITKADEENSSALLFCQNLDLGFFPNPWTPKDWETLFSTEQERLLIVMKNHAEIIGFALFDFSIPDAFAHLLKIVIHPERRGQRHGEHLLRFSLSTLKIMHIDSIFLEVEETNNTAQKLYQSQGFAVIHRKKDFYGQNRAALIMTKSI